MWGWPLEGWLCSEDDSAGVIRESWAKPGFPQEIFSAVQAEKKRECPENAHKAFSGHANGAPEGIPVLP